MTFRVYAFYQDSLLTYNISTIDFKEFKGSLVESKGKRINVPAQIVLTRMEGNWLSKVPQDDLIKEIGNEIERYFKNQL